MLEQIFRDDWGRVVASLVGYLRDISGNYDGGFLTLIAMAVAGAAAIALLPARPSASLDSAPNRPALI